MDSGLQTISKAMEYRGGKMEPVMKVCGAIAKLVERENSGILMETSLKGSGKMIKPMGLGSIHTPTAQATRAFGKMTCSMARAKSFGSMGVSTLETTKWARSTDKVNIGGQMEVHSMELGKKIRSRGQAPTLGLTGASIQADG